MFFADRGGGTLTSTFGCFIAARHVLPSRCATAAGARRHQDVHVTVSLALSPGSIIATRYSGRRTLPPRRSRHCLSRSDARFYHRDALQQPAHVATKTFMALRIFVNNELNELHNGLELANQLLTPGGVCAAIEQAEEQAASR